MIDLSSPSEHVETEEDNEVIKQAIEELSEKHRQVIMMHYGFSNHNGAISEMSKELNISRPACMKLLQEAEKSLKNKLQRYFG
jgi:RNA polymerase sigma factor (sigma-70 family)